jgi:transposase
MKASEQEQARKRRQHSPEFKAGAVRLVTEQGMKAAEVARDLGINRTQLDTWVRQARIDGGQNPKGALTTAEREELARLKKENRELRMERELLKKAAAFFAKENA